MHVVPARSTAALSSWSTRVLSRCASGTGATRALPTRKQVFKEHLVKLREQDPDRWTTYALSRHFGVPLTNVQAMLTLYDADKSGSIDLDELAAIVRDLEQLKRTHARPEEDALAC